VYADHFIEQLGALILTISITDQIFIGIFDTTHPWHFSVSIVFFIGITYGWFIHGSGIILNERKRTGVAIMWLGILHTTGWVLWSFVGIEGIAIPETIGAILLAIWVLELTHNMREGSSII
ncbi:MAG: hypothetical protein ABEI86_04130, partial [Halobacteriaceae archaeon]